MNLLELLLKEGKAEYPKGHKPGVKVPIGGSMCANCEYWNSDKNECNNKYWQQWAETKKIPYAGNQYCCDWWERGKPVIKKKD